MQGATYMCVKKRRRLPTTMDTPVIIILLFALILTSIPSTGAKVRSFVDGNVIEYDTSSDKTGRLSSVSLQFKDGLVDNYEKMEKEYLFMTQTDDQVTLYHDSKKVYFKMSSDTYQGYAAMDTSTEWHTVSLTFGDKEAALEVDGAIYYSYIDAVPSLGAKVKLSSSDNPFSGCMDNFTLNGVNIQESPSFDALTEDCLYPSYLVSFSGENSFVNMSIDPETNTTDITLDFMFRIFSIPADLAELFLDSGDSINPIKVEVTALKEVKVIGGSSTLTFTNADLGKLDNGNYHKLTFRAMLNSTVDIEIDNKPLTSDGSVETFLTTHENSTFVGVNIGSHSATGIKGCMSKFRLTFSGTQNPYRYLSDFGNNGAVIGSCAFRDWCVHEPCAHGVVCDQKETSLSYNCECSAVGYERSDCLKPFYDSKLCTTVISTKQIDPDGAGPLGYISVNCVDDSGKVVTEVPTLGVTNDVAMAEIDYPYSKKIEYKDANIEQILSIIRLSEECTQKISFSCKNSRLMTKMAGTDKPYGYWTGGLNSSEHYYWGDSDPRNLYRCADGNPCKCDDANKRPATDEGRLTTMTDLPVSGVVFNETVEQGKDKSATYTVGPLACSGDVFLNSDSSAVTFTTGESVMMVDVDEGDAAVDISFMFKTKGSRGYLIHSEVVEIDDGPDIYFAIGISSKQEAFVTIQSRDVHISSYPVQAFPTTNFNDGEWHTVYFEMTHRDAFIKIDFTSNQIWSTTDFLPYPKLYPTRKLYVGGSPKKMMGHIGCIKNLHVRGKYIDLHTYVKGSGIEKGCVGKCVDNPCLNGGTCMEYYNTFSCQCQTTGYTGCYCGKDTSWAVSQNASIKYNLPSQTATSDKIFQLGFSTGKKNSSVVSLLEGTNKADISIDNTGGLKADFTDGTTVQSKKIGPPVDNNKPHYVTLFQTESEGNAMLTLQLDGTNNTLEGGPTFTLTNAHTFTIGKTDASLTADATFEGCMFSFRSNDVKIILTTGTVTGTSVSGDCAPSNVPTSLEAHKEGLMAYIENSKTKNEARKPPRVESFSVESMPSHGMENVMLSLVEPITLKCDVDGVPSPRVLWKKDDAVLPVDCYHLMTNDSLVILPTDLGTTAGKYQCEAKNAWGVSRSLNAIQLQHPKPLGTLVVIAKSETVNEGESYSFECAGVTDVPEAEALWFRVPDNFKSTEGQLIWPGAGSADDRVMTSNGKLQFRYVLPEDKYFTCERFNPATGEIKPATQITLTVNAPASQDYRDQPPKIVFFTTSPYNVDEGNDVILECRIRDFKKPRNSHIMWYHEGMEKETGTMYGEVLVLKKVTAENAGEYSCKLNGTENMVNITVEVASKPKFLSSPAVLMKNNGESAVFNCKLDTENYTVTWFSNWSPLTVSDRYELSDSNTTLTIKNLSKATDVQTISCIAEVGDITLSTEGAVSVINKLLIKSSPKDVTIENMENGVVEFYLGVSADPVVDLTYTWLKNNVTVTDLKPEKNNVAEIITIKPSNTGCSLKLDFSKMTTSDRNLFRGEYLCQVSDGVSVETVSSSIFIKAITTDGLSSGAIIGIVIGVIFGVTIIAGLIAYYFYNKNRSNRKYGIEGTVGAYKNPAYTN